METDEESVFVNSVVLNLDAAASRKYPYQIYAKFALKMPVRKSRHFEHAE